MKVLLGVIISINKLIAFDKFFHLFLLGSGNFLSSKFCPWFWASADTSLL